MQPLTPPALPDEALAGGERLGRVRKMSLRDTPEVQPRSSRDLAGITSARNEKESWSSSLVGASANAGCDWRMQRRPNGVPTTSEEHPISAAACRVPRVIGAMCLV